MSSLSIIDQITRATRRTNRAGLAIGALTGALAPAGVFAIAHVPGVLNGQPLYMQPMAYLAAGGLVFSAHSVVVWASRLFRSPVKAVGWTILCEGLMTFAPVQLAWLSWVCLAYLVLVNAISNGCNVALDKVESRTARAPRRVSSSSNVRRIKAA